MRPSSPTTDIPVVYTDSGRAQLFPHGEIQFASERAGGLQVVSAPYLQMESEPTKADLHELHFRGGRAQHTFMPRRGGEQRAADEIQVRVERNMKRQHVCG